MKLFTRTFFLVSSNQLPDFVRISPLNRVTKLRERETSSMRTIVTIAILAFAEIKVVAFISYIVNSCCTYLSDSACFVYAMRASGFQVHKHFSNPAMSRSQLNQ
ncbi:hypothetical protein ACN38_g305 [Penicillium nordicum]|uniref:Uncharacterized protein n=1 Tax=Penicillium nordicum TaxID=229535 RepID=A0A0M8PHH0_9EURO|nr:hypothetical protein ACN38_g305 [Penicillium nordicum]